MPGKAVAKLNGGKLGKKKAPTINHRQLSKKHVHAATLQAQLKSASEICKSVGITIKQLERMRVSKIYQDEVERQVTIFRNRVDGSILGQKAKRIAKAEEDFKALETIQERRASHAKDDPLLIAAGGETGIVVERETRGRGKKKLRVFEVDHATLQQKQSIRKEVATELGEIGAGREGNTGIVVVVNLNKEEQSWL